MTEPEISLVPELVPARMVNEFSYCPRLFFIEWVQARFTDNAETVEGRWHHRVVDRESGDVPVPEGDLRFKARSVSLSSPRLGLVGKADLLEGDGEAVSPVDYKRGRPPNLPDRAWEPERIQLCVIGLLLRDAGYSCTEGVLYFATTHERVTVEFDDSLVERTQEVLAELREVAKVDVPPPPLVDSPKCPRCSVVGICLPDETNALTLRAARPPRRLLPRDPDDRPVYVTEQGTYVKKSKNRLEITRDSDVLASVRMIDVSQLCVYGNVQISTQVLRELFALEVPVCWFSYGGWFSGLAEGLPGKHIELRRRQFAAAGRGGLGIASRMIEGKVRNSRTLLMRNARSRPDDVILALKQLAAKARAAPSIETLLGVEGAAARSYFQSFATMLRDEGRLPGAGFDFEGRNRRPPKDAVNCLLSFTYGLLVKDCTTTLFSVGFDPYLGMYHRPRFGRPALALDLAEEFRPLIAESVVINLINNGEVKGTDFTLRAGGIALSPAGRKAVLAAYERRLDHEVTHPIFGYTVSYRRVLDVQSRLLGAHLLDEIPEYVPFVTR
jgi:CRISP-associated protein Cas1